MEEQLIKFKTAKLAKEKGFKHNSKCYKGNGEILENIENHTNNMMQRFRYEAPTQSLLQKWLREKHNIDIIIRPSYSGYYAILEYDLPNKLGSKVVELLTTYEQALEKGLYQALKLI